MAATEQSQAIQNANLIINLSGQLLGLYNSIILANNAWQDDGSLSILSSMTTISQNSDGTLGTADGSPNLAHPLNINTYSGLSRAVSVNQLTSALTQLNNIVSYINGSSLSGQVGIRSVLNQVTGG